MFEEILECVLEFIGSHSELHGCSGEELLSFIAIDVLPYYGLIDHATLRQMVLGLLVSEDRNISVKKDGRCVVPSEFTNSPIFYNQCIFHPTLSLQEKVLGISLSRKNVQVAVNYVCDNFLLGISRFNKDEKQKDSYSSISGLSLGLRKLLRLQWLRVLYVSKDSSMLPAPFFFPHFAVPSFSNYRRQPQRPLEAYLERRRRKACPHFAAIDPNVVRGIIMSSPERRLVFEDAVHAIYAAHGHVTPNLTSRKMSSALRRLLSAAGLRVVFACITVKQKTHKVRVVVPSNDQTAPDGGDSGTGNNSFGNEDDSDDDDDDKSADNEEEENHADGETAGVCMSQGNNDFFFPIDPSYPLALQVAKEAERRPLTIESVLPRVTLCDTRVTEGELHRFTRQFEALWGTIESTSVLSRRSKAFTRLLRPKGWSYEGGNSANIDKNTASNEDKDAEADAALPKGISRWSVNTVIEALRAAPFQALFLCDLAKIVDRSTLGRLLPYLRGEGLVSTTGISAANGKRIGLVILAGVELNEEKRQALVQSYIANRSERQNKLKQPGVVLQHLPEPADGSVGHSAVAAAIARSNARSARTVAKITMMRNGYSRVGLFRLSRLHLELWRLWCLLGQVPSVPISLELLLQEMSLSSFCIVVGLSDVDVSEYVGKNASLPCAWGTSICRLPPSLQEYCLRSGVQPLLHSLSGLRSQGLVVSEQPLAAYLEIPLAEVFVALVSSAQDEKGHSHVFYDGEVMTPQDTCYAVLKFWSESWATVTPVRESHSTVGLIKEVISTEPNLSSVQLTALSRILRMDSAIVAEYILQRQGILPIKKRLISEVMQAAGFTQDSQCAQTSNTRRRIEVSGPLMAGAFEALLRFDDPLARIKDLLMIVRRQNRGLPNLAVYNPYISRAHCSMQTLLQSILSAAEGQGEAKLCLMRKIIFSVVSPNLSLSYSGFPGSTATAECGNGEKTTEASETEDKRCDGCEKHANPEEPSEELQDVLRMILLSDETHYDAVAAKLLLAQFTEAEQQRCIDWLLKFPSFRRRVGASGRLLRIELSPVITLLPAKLALKITHGRSATATFMQDITTSLLFMPQSNCRRWCVPHVAPADDATGGDLLRRAPSLLEQPFINLDSLADEIREQNGLRILRLPRFSWALPTGDDSKKPPPSILDGANVTDVFQLLSDMASKHHGDESCPARRLLLTWKRLQHLGFHEIPADLPPSEEQVATARSARTVLNERLSFPRYPSIFHHVDGSFHDFLWRSFLFAVYALVHYSPGITGEQIALSLKKNGLVSSESCRVGLEFLKQSQVLVSRSVLVPLSEEVQSPFSTSSVAYQHRECYFCTMSRDGPWNIINL